MSPPGSAQPRIMFAEAVLMTTLLVSYSKNNQEMSPASLFYTVSTKSCFESHPFVGNLGSVITLLFIGCVTNIGTMKLNGPFHWQSHIVVPPDTKSMQRTTGGTTLNLIFV